MPTVGMVVALSTACRGEALTAFPARAERLGFRHVALDASLDAGALEALVPGLLATGFAAAAVEAPCPRPPGQRPPRPASDDREERLAATRAFAATLDTAAELGARLVVVRLGVLPGAHGEAEVARAFARGELDDEARDKLVAGRRARSAQALDLARYAVDAMLGRAAAAGVTVGLCNRSRWYEIPSAAEVAALLDEFSGAPLAPFYDPAAAHVRAALGLGTGRPAVEIEAAAGAFLVDASGLRAGLPWTTGEVDRTLLAKLPESAPRIVRSSLSTDEELLAAWSQ